MQKVTLLFISFILFSCQQQTANLNQSSEDHTRRIVILYTNDEHGWMEPNDQNGGAPGMMGLWKYRENFKIDGPFLILSGGDMWTGPAISTWFEGKSMVEVMNAMEYDASAIGNHEFDFKVEGLYERIDQADFPYLSANIREKASGEIPDFADLSELPNTFAQSCLRESGFESPRYQS